MTPTVYHISGIIAYDKEKKLGKLVSRLHIEGQEVEVYAFTGVRHGWGHSEDFTALLASEAASVRVDGKSWLPRDRKGFGPTPDKAVQDLLSKVS